MLAVITALAVTGLAGCKHSAPKETSFDRGAIILIPATFSSHPAIGAATARTLIGNSTAWPVTINETSAHPAKPALASLGLRLARITVLDSSRLVGAWTRRLAWYFTFEEDVVDMSRCPSASSPDPKPTGPEHHVIAVDASGAGDGLVYYGTGVACGSIRPPLALTLDHLWSATWRVRAEAPAKDPSVRNLEVTPPDCGTQPSAFPPTNAPDTWAELYQVPYGKTGCPAEPQRFSNVFSSTVRPALKGWVRVHDGELLPALGFGSTTSR